MYTGTATATFFSSIRVSTFTAQGFAPETFALPSANDFSAANATTHLELYINRQTQLLTGA